MPVLLQPPGWIPPDPLPHWPYAQAVDEVLTARGIPAGVVRVNCTGPGSHASMYMRFRWDVSRTGGLGGVQLDWTDDTGWAYTLFALAPAYDVVLTGLVTELHRVFARPDAVTTVTGCAPGAGPAATTTRNGRGLPGSASWVWRGSCTRTMIT